MMVTHFHIGPKLSNVTLSVCYHSIICVGIWNTQDLWKVPVSLETSSGMSFHNLNIIKDALWSALQSYLYLSWKCDKFGTLPNSHFCMSGVWHVHMSIVLCWYVCWKWRWYYIPNPFVWSKCSWTVHWLCVHDSYRTCLVI